jgi:hypothetical protein
MSTNRPNTPKPSRRPRPVKRQGVVVVNPAASSVPLDSPTPFAAVAPPEPVRPITTPRDRQLVPGGAVKIIGRTPSPFAEGV